MKYGYIADLEKPISRLIMGTMIYSPGDMPLTCVMLDYFVSLGGNTLDTAHVYGQGDCERAVGEWMRLRENRAEIVIIGKGAHHDAHGPRVNPAAIASDLEESLQRLGTDYIDLYLLHRDDPTVPVDEIVTCLNEHYKAGRIRAFGGSNWSHQRIQEALDYAYAHGSVPFVASSSNFSLAVMNEPPWPGAISATIEGKDWYKEQQFPSLAWPSQAQGFFTGRAAPDNYTDAEMVRVWYNTGNFERLARASALGKQKGVSANTIALAYVLCQPFPTFALIGPRTQEETRTSIQALGIALRREELQWLNLEDDTILVDPRARAFVSGVGYQWAGKGAVQRTHQSWPELRLLQTESECGDGNNTWDYAHYVFTLLHHYLSNGTNGYVYWNMVLPPGGRSTWGWTQNSMVTVDTTQQTVTYNPEFYVMKHLAHFVAPGSVRLDLQGPWSGNALAFQTPDRSTVVVCANPFSEQAEVVIDVASERFFLRLDARSFNTIVLDG